jgi:hypothetical protein
MARLPVINADKHPIGSAACEPKLKQIGKNNEDVYISYARRTISS